MRGRQSTTKDALLDSGIIKYIQLDRERVGSFDDYPFDIPAIHHLEKLELHPKVTFLIGENGSGKSTIIEAIAVAAGFNPEGGTKNFNFTTRPTSYELSDLLTVVRGIRREEWGYFLRAESFFNVATTIETPDVAGQTLLPYFGGKSFHIESHGEGFMRLAELKFTKNGIYILDEPEAALSPNRQLSFLRLIHDLVTNKSSQFIIATHSPIIMAYPNSTIYRLGSGPIEPVAYEETEHYLVTRGFLANREFILERLFNDNPDPDS